MIDHLFTLGICMMIAAGIVQNIHLAKLDKYLEMHHPDIWQKWGTGNSKLNFMSKLYRLKMLTMEFTSDDVVLASKLRFFIHIQYLFFAGLIVMLIGLYSTVFSG